MSCVVGQKLGRMYAAAGPDSAQHLAQNVPTGMPQRWQHTRGVAGRAQNLAVIVDNPADRDLLLAAAWLHDIGYASALRTSGFHPLDGARYLLSAGWPLPVVALVARHSDAADVAEVRGLSGELATFPSTAGPVDDALTYADQTVGPDGHSVSFGERLAEMLLRHGPTSPNAVAHARREPVLRAAICRVDARLARHDIPSFALLGPGAS
jgi:putative nucleotidyltransferase with HDIG domain